MGSTVEVDVLDVLDMLELVVLLLLLDAVVSARVDMFGVDARVVHPHGKSHRVGQAKRTASITHLLDDKPVHSLPSQIVLLEDVVVGSCVVLDDADVDDVVGEPNGEDEVVSPREPEPEPEPDPARVVRSSVEAVLLSAVVELVLTLSTHLSNVY